MLSFCSISHQRKNRKGQQRLPLAYAVWCIFKGVWSHTPSFKLLWLVMYDLRFVRCTVDLCHIFFFLFGSSLDPDHEILYDASLICSSKCLLHLFFHTLSTCRQRLDTHSIHVNTMKPRLSVKHSVSGRSCLSCIVMVIQCARLPVCSFLTRSPSVDAATVRGIISVSGTGVRVLTWLVMTQSLVHVQCKTSLIQNPEIIFPFNHLNVSQRKKIFVTHIVIQPLFIYTGWKVSFGSAEMAQVHRDVWTDEGSKHTNTLIVSCPLDYSSPLIISAPHLQYKKYKKGLLLWIEQEIP